MGKRERNAPNGNLELKPRIGNLRAYLASTGATGALVAGAIVAFLSVGALVAFNGNPLGGDDASGTVGLAEGPGAPEAAAVALAPAPDAVAAAPAGGTVLAAILPGFGPGGGGPGGGGGGGGGSTQTGGGGDDGGGTTTPPPGGGGTVGGVVDGVDDTTSGLGVDLPLAPATKPLTDQLDQTVDDTLNGAGGLLGQPNLGGNVTDAVNGLTGSLLGD